MILLLRNYEVAEVKNTVVCNESQSEWKREELALEVGQISYHTLHHLASRRLDQISQSVDGEKTLHTSIPQIPFSQAVSTYIQHMYVLLDLRQSFVGCLMDRIPVQSVMRS